MGRSNVTSADVAAAAGVSRATVSYVLNGVDARVSEGTRERVLEAARTLGYTPNAMASALRAGRTSVVIFALPNWPLGPVVAELLSGSVGELDRLGYTPLVHFVHASGPDGLQRACDRVRPVGLIAPASALPPLELLRANGTRGIVTLGPPPEPGVPSFTLEQEPCRRGRDRAPGRAWTHARAGGHAARQSAPDASASNAWRVRAPRPSGSA